MYLHFNDLYFDLKLFLALLDCNWGLWESNSAKVAQTLLKLLIEHIQMHGCVRVHTHSHIYTQSNQVRCTFSWVWVSS